MWSVFSTGYWMIDRTMKKILRNIFSLGTVGMIIFAVVVLPWRVWAVFGLMCLAFVITVCIAWFFYWLLTDD